MTKIIRLTGAAPNSDGHPLYIDVDTAKITIIATIEQKRPGKSSRLVTEIWIGKAVKYVQEHVSYVLRYWTFAKNTKAVTEDSLCLIEPPKTTEWLELARLTYQPLVPVAPPKKKKVGLFR
jgi:hypothetical protein